MLPEQSTEVGDLIHPVPGVLYEDARLKKGDPGQYQVSSLFFLLHIPILFIHFSLEWHI